MQGSFGLNLFGKIAIATSGSQGGGQGQFPEMEPQTTLTARSRSHFGHYREIVLYPLRTSVTKTGNFSVENVVEIACSLSLLEGVR
jgi:hypothetical protein